MKRLLLLGWLILLLPGGCQTPYPGSASTERSVQKHLRWLRDSQNPDGSWGTPAATAQLTPLVVLVLMGHGETPASCEYGLACLKALQWLAGEAALNDTPAPLTAWASATSYSMTKMPMLEAPARKQLKKIVRSQQADGSFQYFGDSLLPAQRGNTVPHCLNLIALEAGYSSGLYAEENELTLRQGLRWLIYNCFLESDNAFSLYPGVENPVLTWYAVTMASFYAYEGKGEGWSNWNRTFTKALVKHQDEKGCWSHPEAGRIFHNDMDRTIFCSAMFSLSLEVYYAFLPTFHCLSSEFSIDEPGKDDDRGLRLE